MFFGEKFLKPSKYFSIEGEGAGDAGGAGGGAGGEGGGDGEGTKNKNKSDTVSKAEFDKVLDELHKHKKSNKELTEEKKKNEEARLKEANDWKTLAEAREKERDESKAETSRIMNSFTEDKKFNAVQAAATALGLKPEAMSDLENLDLSKVQIETTSTGKINVLGSKEFAENLKTLKPHWFGEKSAPRVNSDGTRVRDNGGAITPQAILKAEQEGRKSGDMSGYTALVKKYQTQRIAGRR